MNSKKLPAILAFFSMLAVTGNAALVISNTDISNDQYSYSLTFSDLLSSGTTFYDEVFSHSGVTVINESTQRYISTGTTSSSGSFTYRFDFSTTDYRPTEVSIADRVTLFNNAPSGAQILVEYRINDGAWVTLSSLTQNGSVQDLNKYSSPWVVSFDSLGGSVASTFDYRVSFVGTSTTNVSDQWGRSSSSQTPLSITFDVAAIPEPSTAAALMGLGALGLTVFRRGRRFE